MTALCSMCAVEHRLPYNHSWCRGCRNKHSRENRTPHNALSPEEKVKSNARSYANVYQRRGLLIPRPCEGCGAKAEKHHPNYLNPLDVNWLCRDCHLSLHRGDRVFSTRASPA